MTEPDHCVRCKRPAPEPSSPEWARLELEGGVFLVCPDCHATVALEVGETVAQHARDAAAHLDEAVRLAERDGEAAPAAREAAELARKIARVWESEAAHADELKGGES